MIRKLSSKSKNFDSELSSLLSFDNDSNDEIYEVVKKLFLMFKQEVTRHLLVSQLN